MWNASNSSDPVRDFNADPTAGTLSTNAVLQARDKSQNLDVPLLWSGKFWVDQMVEFVKPVCILGMTRARSVLLSSASTAVRFSFSQGWQQHDIRDLSIVPTVDNAGAYGLDVTLVNAAANLGYFNYHRLHIGAFGTRGMIWNNTVPSGQPDDGFFIGSVEDCFVANGFTGINIGDSLIFNRVKFHGKNNVSLSGVPGQREVIFRDGQITTRAGFMQLKNISGVFTENQWMEHPTYLSAYEGDANGAAILLDNVADSHFNNDTIGVHSADQGPGPYPAHVIAMIGNTRDITIIDETFLNRGWASHVYATNGVARIRVPTLNNGNKFNGIAPLVALQGAGPYWT